MKGEVLADLNFLIWHEIAMPDGGRIVDAWPIDQKHWPSLDLANHNVFRLDAHNQVIWQVTRVETIGQRNWEVANRQAKEKDPNCEGYYDPFTHLGTAFFERHPLPEKPSSYSRLECNPTFEEIGFDTYAPGRLLWLTTRSWVYDLDPATGIATCTCEQFK
jgi:hypothetical protein